MTWLLLDVLLYVAAAALFGGVVGWWSRIGAERRRLAEIEDERGNLATGYERAERARLDAEAKLAEREAAWAAERNALIDELATAKEEAARATAAAKAFEAKIQAEAAQAQRFAALEAERSHLQALIAKSDERRREAEARLSEAESKLRDTEAKRTAAEQAGAAALAALAAQDERKEAPSLAVEIDALRRRLADVEREHERARSEITAAQHARAIAEQAHRESETVLRQASTRAAAELAAARKELTDSADERDRSRARQDQAMQALLAGEKLLLAAEEKLHRIAVAEREKAQIGERLAQVERDRDAALARVARAEARLHDVDAMVRVSAALAGDLAVARQRIVALEAGGAALASAAAESETQLRLLRQEAREPAQAGASAMPPATSVDAAMLTTAARNAASGANLPGVPPPRLATPAGRPDDLRRIRGIGPFNEETLHALGIFHFEQIASLTDENIAWLDEYLGFKGRIEREEWVGQARRILASKSRGAAD